MSVINQMLLDLERRGASAAERSMLPTHVRALPDVEKAIYWEWIAGGAAAAAGAIAAGWVLFAGYSPVEEQPGPPARRSGTEVTIERVVTASARVATPLGPEERIESLLPEPPVFRMSFELSAVPDEPASGRDAETPSPAPAAQLPASRVVVGTATEPPATGQAQSATAGRLERAPARKSDPAPPAKYAAGAAASGPGIQKRERPPTARDLAENEYRKSVTSWQQERLAEAQEGFEAALNLVPEHHSARQGLVSLLVRAGRFSEAERVLQEGVTLAPAQTGFTVTLARLQADRGDNARAIATLQAGLRYAQGNPDYLAFLAALLQGQGRHEEAIEQFQSALRARPSLGVWWLGLGMSLQAVNRTADAQEAYRLARTSNNLPPELAAYAEQRLRQLQ
jgi:MSHA biogenesis protein MshN